MNRKTKSKNPLLHMFGAYVRRERNLKNLTSKDVAEKLEMADSAYRLMEAGEITLQPYKFFLFLKIFDESNIQYDRLCKYVSAASYIDSLLEHMSAKEAILELAERDTDFFHFHANTVDYYTYDERNEALRAQLASTFANEVRSFLVDRQSPNITDSLLSPGIEKEISEVPSLTLQLLLQFIKPYKAHPPLHVGKIAKDWENNNSNNFTEFIGLFADPGLIINDYNFNNFQYLYLDSSTFKSSRFIFVTDETSDTIKNKFEFTLNKARLENGVALLTENERDKIMIKTIRQKQFAEEVNKILRDENANNQSLQGFWNFSMSENYNVAFIANQVSKDFYYILNLNVMECKLRKNLCELIWQSKEV